MKTLLRFLCPGKVLVDQEQLLAVLGAADAMLVRRRTKKRVDEYVGLRSEFEV